MALCGSCGTGEDKIKADGNEWCGACHADDWIQWEDFFEKPGLTTGKLSYGFWKSVIEKIGAKNMIELMILVLDSEVEHYSRGEGLTWIFRHKIGPGIIKAIKNG